jgi:hypothetical protein
MSHCKLVLDPYGLVTLLEGTRRIWSSDNSNEFAKVFEEIIEEDDIDDVAEWLMEQGIIEDEDVDIEVQDAEDWDDDDEDEDEDDDEATGMPFG